MPELVNATIDSVHSITTELRPSLLDDLGLPAAIEWQTADFQKRSGIGITQWQIDDCRSFGMIGMRERAHLWGGTVHVRNAKPSGTAVRVIIPLIQR